MPQLKKCATSLGCQEDKYTIRLGKVKQHTLAFLDAVEDPQNPTCCPWCFNVFLFGVMNAPEALSALKRSAHDLWVKCISLIVIYAESDVSHLRRRLADNQRRCSERRERHKFRCSRDLTDSFDIFIDGMLDFVRAGLTKGKNPLYAGERKQQTFHRRNGVWPKDIKSLCPSEVNRTVDALVHWCCAPVSPNPLLVLELYLMTARPLVMPALLESPRRERLIWAFLQALTPGPGVPWNGPPPFARPRGLAVPLALRRDGEMVEIAISLLGVIRADFGARSGDATRFVTGHEAPLLAALESHAPEQVDLRDAIAWHKCLLRAVLGRGSGECLQGAVQRTHVVYDFLERCVAMRTCAGPGCAEAELSEIHGVRRFLSCELCRVVRYCSKACQRADWEQGSPRHKDMCPLVAALRNQGVAMDSGKGAFNKDVAEAGYDSRDIEMLYAWAAHSEVLPASIHGPKKPVRVIIPCADKSGGND